MTIDESPYVHSLLLAREVALVGSDLQVSGGGLTTFYRVFPSGSPPPFTGFGIAVIVAVRWHQIKRESLLMIELRDEDAKTLERYQCRILQGEYPTGVYPGRVLYRTYTVQRELLFPHTGGYEVVAHIEGSNSSERRWVFQVQDVTG